MSHPSDPPARIPAVEQEPRAIDLAFLRAMVGATSSYTEGWREMAARLLWAESKLTGQAEEIARLTQALNAAREEP